MARALALNLRQYGIRVNTVLPGMIQTERWQNNYNNCRSALSNFTPLGGIAEFDDIANAVRYTSESRNTTGAELTVDGGNIVQLYPILPEVCLFSTFAPENSGKTMPFCTCFQASCYTADLP